MSRHDTSSPLIEMRSIHKAFGGVHARLLEALAVPGA